MKAVAGMKSKIFAFLLKLTGFLASIGFPIWAASSQIAILRASCGDSILERIGITAGGAVIIVFIVGFTAWRYVSVWFREKLRSHRTLVGFFLIGYIMILCIRPLLGTLEVIFLGGTLGAAVAVVCYALADIIEERNK